MQSGPNKRWPSRYRKDNLRNINIDININIDFLENINIDKEILRNIDINKIWNQLEFGVSNRAI